MSELSDVLKSVYYETPVGYENVDWFVDEVMNLKNEVIYFKNTRRKFIMTEEDKEHYKIKKDCRFHEIGRLSDKFRDRCHLTDKYTGPAYNKRNNNVTRKQNNFIPFAFHNFSIFECHLFLEELIDKN